MKPIGFGLTYIDINNPVEFKGRKGNKSGTRDGFSPLYDGELSWSVRGYPLYT